MVSPPPSPRRYLRDQGPSWRSVALTSALGVSLRSLGAWDSGENGAGDYRQVSRDQDSAWVTDGPVGIRQGGVWTVFGSWPLLPEHGAGGGWFDSGEQARWGCLCASLSNRNRDTVHVTRLLHGLNATMCIKSTDLFKENWCLYMLNICISIYT